MYARNHLIYEGFLNNAFSRRLQTPDGARHLNKFPKSYGNKLYFSLGYITVGDNTDNNDNILNTQRNVMKESGNVIAIQDFIAATISMNDPATLNGLLAYQIDKKVDDGNPLTGIIGNWSDGHGGNEGTCLSSDKYDTARVLPCNMAYKLK